MYYNTEEWCKIRKENDLWFEKLHEEFGEFDPTLKSIKICTIMGSFWAKYIMFELKTYRGVMHHYTEDRCKLRRKITCVFLNDIGIWWTSSEHSKILKFALWETFLSKVYNIWAEKLQRSYVSWHWRGM